MLFNHSQRKGVLVLLVLLTALMVLPRQFLQGEHTFFWLADTLEIINDTFRDSPGAYVKKAGAEKRPYAAVSKLELNAADSAALVAVRGIGPYYAMKIIRYRERLGGFISLRQLKEIKMTYFNADSAEYFFRLDPSLIVKRKLDTMSFRAVLRHPYLEYEDVQLIFNAKRKYHTLSYSLLEERKVLPAYKLKKIRPYFE